MSGGRAEILSRVREALADMPAAETPDDVPVRRDYRRESAEGLLDLVERFAERVADYRAEVRRVDDRDLAAALRAACEDRGLRRAVIPAALPSSWRPDGIEVIEDERLSAKELDRFDVAITGCAAAIAETGTILLDGGERSGRRAITLVPDHHVCVVEAASIVAGVPDAVAALAAAAGEGRPLTLVSGPSATSDIELDRVEGVHGPRLLDVLVVG
jgi:L-lactate dehydrogenase complex protein LldG